MAAKGATDPDGFLVEGLSREPFMRPSSRQPRVHAPAIPLSGNRIRIAVDRHNQVGCPAVPRWSQDPKNQSKTRDEVNAVGEVVPGPVDPKVDRQRQQF